MTQRAQTLWQKLFTGFMTIFMLIGIISTIGAMQANPPANLDQIVQGNIDENLVELAAETNNEALITEAIVEQPESFFGVTLDNGGDGDRQVNDENDLFDWFDGD